MPYSRIALIRKLRNLKQAEINIRFGGQITPGARLVWDRFFSTDEHHGFVKYPLCCLLYYEAELFKLVVTEYYEEVYNAHYSERGLGSYDPLLLAWMGLPPYANMVDIKQRFRELAKRFHPDAGGDSAKFRKLMDVYQQLVGE
ncbi:MAG: J domain-containing protein [Anaerolineae bacterium]|nr:J domain-containing protein [Anaerolineae bacterium]